MAANKGPVCLSVINMKGGVGKTTVAALLSRYASQRWDLNRKVLAVDLDPQANLSQALMGGSGYRRFLKEKSPSIVEVFKGYQPPTGGSKSPSRLDIDDVIVPVGGPDLHVIPSRFDFSDHLIDAIKPDPMVLAKLVANEFQSKDIVIIDCAPTESVFTQAAYHASRYVLVPVKPEYFATIGFPLLNDSLSKFRSENRGHRIDVIGVIVNNSFYHGGNDGGPEKQQAMREIREEANKNGWKVLKHEMPHSRGFPKMMRGDYRYPGNAYEASTCVPAEVFSKMGF